MKLKYRVSLAVISCSLVGIILSNSAYAFFPIDLEKIKYTIKPSLLCDSVRAKVQTKLDNANSKKITHDETYTKLKDRFSEKISYWKDIGYDVEQLEEDLEDLEDLIDKFRGDYDYYIDALENVYDKVCDTTEYNNALDDAKSALLIVRQDATDIKNFYFNEIRPHILDLKEQELNDE